ncbi:MAG: hypothetical protein II704_00580 [Erysipelotrichaceae bacterium]|nr:hypothetical protein [Erysipelotrichaceae bacterium]
MTKLKNTDKEKLFQIVNIAIILLIILYYLIRAIYYRGIIDHVDSQTMALARSICEAA